MKLISWNVNGLRAVQKKGFPEWFSSEDADIICLQEIKAKPEQLAESLRQPSGYHAHYCPAQKPGYSGVVTYSKQAPLEVVVGMGYEPVDVEGRILLSHYEHFSVLNAYMPHSRRDLSRIDFKMDFCRRFLNWVKELKKDGRRLIICGDYNVSHQEIDLKNAKANRKNAGFLPEERAWMDDLLGLGFRDVFRDAHPDEEGHYTWWSNRKGVRERNVGWRIDYFCIDQDLAPLVIESRHQSDIWGSDHCPVMLQIQEPC